MNQQLEVGLQEWADKVREKGAPKAQDGVRLMNMMTGAVVQGYDFMDQRMPSGWEAEAGKDFQIFDFVNPSVAKPIFDLEQDGFDLDGMEPQDPWEEEVERERDRRRRGGRDR